MTFSFCLSAQEYTIIYYIKSSFFDPGNLYKS